MKRTPAVQSLVVLCLVSLCLVVLPVCASLLLAAQSTDARPHTAPVSSKSRLAKALAISAGSIAAPDTSRAPRPSKAEPLAIPGGPCLGSTSTPCGRGFALPATFEPNVGQVGPGPAFIGRGRGVTLLLSRDSVAFSVAKHGRGKVATSPLENTITLRARWANDPKYLSENNSENSPSASHGTHHRRGRRSGRSRKKMWEGEQPLASRSNYFLGNDRSEWRTNVPQFARVAAKGWMRGVDMTVHSDTTEDGQAGQLEYDLRLAPSRDASKLRLEFSGAENVKIDQRGDLALELH